MEFPRLDGNKNTCVMVAYLVQAAQCGLFYSVKYNQIIVRYGKAGQAIGKHICASEQRQGTFALQTARLEHLDVVQ